MGGYNFYKTFERQVCRRGLIYTMNTIIHR